MPLPTLHRSHRERFLQSAAGAFSMFSIYISDRLGLYCALTEGGPATSAELAARAPGLGFGLAGADAMPPFF